MIRRILEQSLAHAGGQICRETEAFVKGNDFRVGGTDLKVDFRTAERFQRIFGMAHDLRGEPLPLIVRIDRKV